jgi:hypothetical protein
MPITKFTAENWPESATEFRHALQEAWCGGAPIDEFVQLVRDLTLLEQKHGLSSAEFYERYQREKWAMRSSPCAGQPSLRSMRR